MRARLALLVAFAVVFVPGWYWEQAGAAGDGRELVARALAPTLEEAALRDVPAAMAKSLDGRKHKAPRQGLQAAALAAMALAPLAAACVAMGLAGHPSAAATGCCTSHPVRAPPFLQPV